MKSLRRFIVCTLLFFVSFAAAAETPQYGLLFPAPDESILSLLTREDIANADSWFATAEVGASLYEARQDLFMPRWQPAISAGKRFGRTGVFGQFEYNESFDFTQDVKKLEVYHVGIGVDHVFLYGRVKSSISAGFAILGTNTDFDTKGTRGWYADFRPITLRFPAFTNQVIELCPLSMNVSVPVNRGIPLILFSYFTTLSIEFGGGEKF